ncbi:MAG: hypothetical protein JKP96_09055 [Oceanicaulis sp.]|jgi:hypothetical protein|nr:hypothetical protein [Oceanicaulis sp.]
MRINIGGILLDLGSLLIGAVILFLSLLYQPDWIWYLASASLLVAYGLSKYIDRLYFVFLFGLGFALTYTVYPMNLLIQTGMLEVSSVVMRTLYFVIGVLVICAGWGIKSHMAR